MDTKSLTQVEIKEVGGAGLVTAVFSTLGVVDHHGDITEPGAFEDGASVQLSAWNHSSWMGVPPVGRGVIRAGATEAVMEGEFFLATAAGREHFEVVKALGELGEWSYGFDVLDSADGEHEGRSVRYLRKLRVIEVSPVIRGAGIDTRTLAVKAARGAASADEIAQAVIAHQAKAAEREAAEQAAAKERCTRDEQLHVIAAAHGIDIEGGAR